MRRLDQSWHSQLGCELWGGLHPLGYVSTHTFIPQGKGSLAPWPFSERLIVPEFKTTHLSDNRKRHSGLRWSVMPNPVPFRGVVRC